MLEILMNIFICVFFGAIACTVGSFLMLLGFKGVDELDETVVDSEDK